MNTIQNFVSFFDPKSGFFCRSDSCDGDPFWDYNGPELLDISITSFCEKGCSFCYRSSNRNGHHMSLSDYAVVMDQAKSIGVYQVALGGGNPNQHPEFCDIIRDTSEVYGIVPTFTTNGDGFSDVILDSVDKYCGAMAISFYDDIETKMSLLSDISSLNVDLNLHVLLDDKTIDKFHELLNCDHPLFNFFDGIVFLSKKPVGRSCDYILTSLLREKICSFIKSISAVSNRIKIGFDSCSISYVLSSHHMHKSTVDYCDAARFTAYINQDLKMYPCSFMEGLLQGCDLHSMSIIDAWRSSIDFIGHRSKMKNTIPSLCSYYSSCNGGCPIFDINFCHCT